MINPLTTLPRHPNYVADGVGYISLPHNRWVLVDAADYATVTDVPWCTIKVKTPAGVKFYACRRSGGKCIYMHRVLIGLDVASRIDHKNGNGLDNRRSNLRLASHSENLGNCKRRHHNQSSRFKGVRAHGKKWIARIASVHVGSFETEELAAKAYDNAARSKYGEFACVNFPIGNERSAVD